MALGGPSRTSVDTGLLILRSSGLFLLLTFGWQKLFRLVQLIYAGESLSSAGLALLIRDAGIPAPALGYVYVTLSESILALLIALGLFTRLSAACAALRCLVSAPIWRPGAHWSGKILTRPPTEARRHMNSRPSAERLTNSGLLLLRIGSGLSLALLFGLPKL